MSYLFQSIPLFKMAIFFFIISKFGFIFGIILSLILHKFHMFLMEKFFKMIPLSPGDLTFVWMNDKDRYNVVLFLKFEEFNAEKIKNLLIERGLKNFQKLRSKLRFKFLEFYWEEVSVEEASKTIEIIKNNDNYCFNTNEDITNCSYGEIDNRIDIMNDFPYRFLIIENDKAKIKNTLLIKFDHSFSDGLGIIGLICGLADNYSLDLFPGFNKKHSILGFIYTFLFLPYLIIYSFYRNLFHLSTKNSPFKIDHKLRAGRSKFQMTELIDFVEISKICKSLNITFNDMIMSLISSASKKYIEENNLKLPKHFSCLVPVSSRKPAENIKDILITNDSTAIGCKIEIISDPIKECNKIKKEFSTHVRNPYFFLFTTLMVNCLNKFFPSYLMRYIIHSTSEGIDFTISNVPGPKSNLIYSGYKVTELIGYTSTGFLSSFLFVFSYNGSFRFVCCFDEALGLDADKYIKALTREVNFVRENSNIKF
jgi:NRPS condensation-like uncharacterized protein